MKLNIKLILLFVVVSCSGLFAQRNTPPPPTAQGPYECEQTTNFNGAIATSTIKPILENIIEEKIDEVNSDDEKDYKIRWKNSSKTKVNSPSNEMTKRRDQPNQKYVLMPFLVQLEVYDAGPLSFERVISFNVNFELFCRGWQNGNGKAEMGVKLTDPIISGGTILEDVLNFFSSGNLTTYINNEIKEKLKFNNNLDDFDFGNPDCDCFKSQKFSNTPPAWEISWDKKRYSAKDRHLNSKSVKIDFQQIIRHKGLRIPTNFREDVVFDIWVNGNYFEYPNRPQNKIVMEESDTHSINDFSVKIPVQDRVETLQIIVVAKGRDEGASANGSRNQSTSGWSEFKKADKYGQGNGSTQTKNEIIFPPSQFNPKPSSSWVKNYELKYKIEYLDPFAAIDPGKAKLPNTKPKSNELLNKQEKLKMSQSKTDN